MNEAIERFLAALQQDRGFSTNTIAAYRNDLVQFELYAANPPIASLFPPVSSWFLLDERALNQFVLHLRERKYANASIARKSAAIKSFCHYLAAQGILGIDPADRMVSPKADRYTPRAIAPEQVERLLAQPANGTTPEHPATLRDSAMLQALYATGMRVSELVSLDIYDVDETRHGVRCTGKAGKTRDLPLVAAWESLSRYLDAGRPRLAPAEEIALFVNHRGGRLTRQGFWLILKTYAEQAGITDVTPHTLRHSFACNALQGGAGVREVQQILGHVSVSTTQIYRRIRPNPESPDVIARENLT